MVGCGGGEVLEVGEWLLFGEACPELVLDEGEGSFAVAAGHVGAAAFDWGLGGEVEVWQVG